MLTVLIAAATIISAALLALVLLAFRRSAFSLDDAAITNLMAGIFWIGGAALLRGMFWDLLPMIVGPDAFRTALNAIGPGTWPNVIFYAVMIGGSLRLLRGFQLMIPADDRPHYSILTAAFYPRRLRLLGRDGEGK